jgi:hypothetical protein
MYEGGGDGTDEGETTGEEFIVGITEVFPGDLGDQGIVGDEEEAFSSGEFCEECFYGFLGKCLREEVTPVGGGVFVDALPEVGSG